MSVMKEKREIRELESKIERERKGENSDDREEERTGGGREGKRGVKGKKERGSRGVVRVQRNEISICWRKKRRGNKYRE